MSELGIANYSSLVAEINQEYNQFKALSNNEIRHEIYRIVAELKCRHDKQNYLNHKLPFVFAILKETARRFALGNVEVTANENDIAAAEDYDFVTIKGDKAVYKNKWLVGGIPFIWNMVHYDEQLLGGILLHYGYAVEMATGEGKTLVATLPAFLNALTQEGVHIMTVNDYLSKRDYELTRPIYIFFGLSVDCIECYSRHDSSKKNAYHCDITFGVVSSFAFDYLDDHLETSPMRCVQRKHNYAIIDELDSVLIDEAATPHIIGGGNRYNEAKLYQDNIIHVKDLINAGENLCEVNLLHKTANFTDQGKSWLRDKIGVDDLFQIERPYQIKNFDSQTQEQKYKILSTLRLQNALCQLLRGLTVCEKDVDYAVVEDFVYGKKQRVVKIIDRYTGRLKPNSRWEHGLHTAIEVKEDCVVQDDYEGVAVISLKNYFKLYRGIAGMSGTIMPVSDELKELYGLKCASLPTHKPVIRDDRSLKIFRTVSQKDEAILDAVIENSKVGRPTLVGCLSMKRAAHISDMLNTYGLANNKLDATHTQEEAVIIAKAGQGNTITVATSIAGRGTDIKLSGDAFANGGLMVLGTDMFSSVRIDLQLKGRSGRQGDPGSSVFFASLEDAILKNLPTEDMAKLKSIVDDIGGDELSCPQVRDFFILAQKKSEEYLKRQIAKTTGKDDIIAPRRKVFYDQRNAVLFDAGYANSIIKQIIEKANLTEQEIDYKMLRLECVVRNILERSLRINPNLHSLSVPFSCNCDLFSISFDLDMRTQKLSHFINDFKRCIILKTYDKYWKRFVVYMMGDLDETEVDGLDARYDNMMEEVHHEIVSLLQNTVVPYDPPKPLEHSIDETAHTKDEKEAKEEGRPNDMLYCPCGSGKKYGECHGRIRRKPKVRR